MSVILRDKINELLTENANLEKEVARLREAERSCLRGTPAATENTDTPRDIIATETDGIIKVMQGLYESRYLFKIIRQVSQTDVSPNDDTDTKPSPVEVRDSDGANHDITQKQKKYPRFKDDDDDKDEKASRKKYEKNVDKDDDKNYQRKKQKKHYHDSDDDEKDYQGKKHKKRYHDDDDDDDDEEKDFQRKRQKHKKHYDDDNEGKKHKKTSHDDDDDDDNDDDKYRNEKYKKHNKKKEKNSR